MINWKKIFRKLLLLIAATKSMGTLPGHAATPHVYRTPIVASIAATVKDNKLKAFAPSADDHKYDYKWKVFQNGRQVGETISGIEIDSELPEGDYSLQLAIEEKEQHKTISIASVDIHAG